MPSNFKRSIAALNAEADSVCALLDDGYLRIYDGSQPDTPDDPITGQVLLAELRFANPAFASAINGIASAHTIAVDAEADASGTASWFRAFKSDGASPVFDGAVGTSGSDINLSTVEIIQGAEVALDNCFYSAAQG